MAKAKYQAKDDASDIVEAEQLTVETEVQTPLGTEPAHPGDWLILDKDGVQTSLTDEEFQQTYGPVDETKSSGRPTPPTISTSTSTSTSTVTDKDESKDK